METSFTTAFQILMFGQATLAAAGLAAIYKLRGYKTNALQKKMMLAALIVAVWSGATYYNGMQLVTSQEKGFEMQMLAAEVRAGLDRNHSMMAEFIKQQAANTGVQK